MPQYLVRRQQQIRFALLRHYCVLMYVGMDVCLFKNCNDVFSLLVLLNHLLFKSTTTTQYQVVVLKNAVSVSTRPAVVSRISGAFLPSSSSVWTLVLLPFKATKRRRTGSLTGKTTVSFHRTTSVQVLQYIHSSTQYRYMIYLRSSNSSTQQWYK